MVAAKDTQTVEKIKLYGVQMEDGTMRNGWDRTYANLRYFTDPTYIILSI